MESLKARVEALILGLFKKPKLMSVVLRNKDMESILTQAVVSLSSSMVLVAETLEGRAAETLETPIGPPCDGGCGGVAISAVLGKNYCRGCLEGAYILNKNALSTAKAKIDELKREFDKERRDKPAAQSYHATGQPCPRGSVDGEWKKE